MHECAALGGVDHYHSGSGVPCCCVSHLCSNLELIIILKDASYCHVHLSGYCFCDSAGVVCIPLMHTSDVGSV